MCVSTSAGWMQLPQQDFNAHHSLLTPPLCHHFHIKALILFSLMLFGFAPTQSYGSMKVHPAAMKRNSTALYNIAYHNSKTTLAATMEGGIRKKLRRLPHTFSRVLELPLRSDADVAIQETPDCFRFVAKTDESVGGGARAQALKIHPGVTRVVVRGGGDSAVEFLLDELDIDAWRFRLPASTRPSLASAKFVDGELIVTVPKGGSEVDDGGSFWGRRRPPRQ